MSNFVIFFALLVSSSFGLAEDFAHDNYKSEAEIPEPMYFDLVRRLGAEKGEFEVNSLFVNTGDPRNLAWAPEVEWAFADNQAVELEFPSLNSELNAFKVAYQKTFNFDGERKPWVHGLQTIYERRWDHHQDEVTAVYLYGRRFNESWSMLGMSGLKTEFPRQGHSQLNGIANVSLFLNLSRRLDLAAEFNGATNFGSSQFYRLIPQLHLLLADATKVQFGVGVSKDRDEPLLPVFALRLIQEFNGLR